MVWDRERRTTTDSETVAMECLKTATVLLQYKAYRDAVAAQGLVRLRPRPHAPPMRVG